MITILSKLTKSINIAFKQKLLKTIEIEVKRHNIVIIMHMQISSWNIYRNKIKSLPLINSMILVKLTIWIFTTIIKTLLYILPNGWSFGYPRLEDVVYRHPMLYVARFHRGRSAPTCNSIFADCKTKKVFPCNHDKQLTTQIANL